jgi:hypothetical protein
MLHFKKAFMYFKETLLLIFGVPLNTSIINKGEKVVVAVNLP